MSEFTTPEPWPTALGDTGVTLYCSGPLMRKIKVIRNFFIATGRDVASDKVKLSILNAVSGRGIHGGTDVAGGQGSHHGYRSSGSRCGCGHWSGGCYWLRI